jgi:hypothetical protein
MKVTLRDLFWLTLLVAVLLGWRMYALRARLHMERVLQRQGELANRDRDWAALQKLDDEVALCEAELNKVQTRVDWIIAKDRLKELELEIAERKARLAIE